MKKINLVVILLFSCIILISSALETRKHKLYHHDKQNYFIDSTKDYLEKDCQVESSLRSKERNPNHRITGGRDAKEGEFPSFVSIGIGLSPGWIDIYCSGVAISKTLVLTATHCFSNKYWFQGIWLVAGIIPPPEWRHRRREIKTYRVAQRCHSPRFRANTEYGKNIHDYAILRLSEPMAEVEPAMLNAVSDLPIGFKAIAVGVGIVDETDGTLTTAKRLQALPVKLVKCLSKDNHYTHICFQSYDEDLVGDTCQGDSGGPIYGLSKNGLHVVLGLTSYGPNICKKGVNNISTNVNIANIKYELDELIRSCSVK